MCSLNLILLSVQILITGRVVRFNGGAVCFIVPQTNSCSRWTQILGWCWCASCNFRNLSASLYIHLILLANVYRPAIMTDNPICYLEISNDIHLRMCIQLTFHFSGDKFAWRMNKQTASDQLYAKTDARTCTKRRARNLLCWTKDTSWQHFNGLAG